MTRSESGLTKEVYPAYIDCGTEDISVDGGCDIIINNPPVAMCNNVVVNAGAGCTADASIDDGSYDPDSDPITITQVPAGPYPLGETVVKLIVFDGELADTCEATVTVVDNTPPVLACPQEIVVSSESGLCGASVGFDLSATDNCDAEVTIVTEPASGSFFPVGTTPVMAIATDAAGNADTCYFNVTVEDNESPAVICPEDIVVVAAPGESSAIVNFVVNATDNCPGATVEAVPASGSVFPLGVTLVTVTATDAAGNTNACNFEVKVLAPPVVADIPDQTIELGQEFDRIFLDDYVTDLDNDPSQITWTATEFKKRYGPHEITVEIDANRVATITTSPGFVGSAVFTFTATDPDGNTGSDQATFSVTSVENQPPVVSDIPDQTINAGESFAPINLDDYVTDPDHADDELTWTYSGNTLLSVSIVNRVATVTYPVGFTGSETITFGVFDPEGAFDSDDATFTVVAVGAPDFAISAAPETVTVAYGEIAPFAYTVDVLSIDDFDGEVTLSVLGLPAGATADFSVNPVTAPGQSILSGNTADDTPVGVYQLIITGESATKALRADTVYLAVEGCDQLPIPVVSQEMFMLNVTEGSSPADETVYVTNGADCGTLYWEAASNESWVTPNPTSGSVEAGEVPGSLLTLEFNTASLAPGQYMAEIEVVAKVPGMGKLEPGAIITIHLTVEPRPESQDTVYVESTSGFPGTQVSVAVNFKNDEELAGMSAGLTWSSADVYLDSVSFVGSRVEHISTLLATINNVGRNLKLGVLRIPPEPLVPVGSGLWCRLWFTINPMAAPGIVEIDSTFIPPGVELIFNDEMANTIYPQFVKGQIEILPAAEACVRGYVYDDLGSPISGATVQLYDEYPWGLIGSTTTDVDGFYEICLFSRAAFAEYFVRAYKSGYYPGSLESSIPNYDADLRLQRNAGSITPTYEWVNLYCDGEAFANDAPIQPGDVIEAFDPDGVVCGRFEVVTAGTFGFMPVYVDDPWTPDIDEGCISGDIITLKLNGGGVKLTDGPLYWTGNGNRHSACFTYPAEITKCIHLKQGWNLISFNVTLPTSDIEALFAEVMGNVDVILSFEAGGLTYDPLLPEFSTLWDVDNLHGYWFRMHADDEICITGDLVSSATPIDLELNWNLVSYLPDEPLPVADALSSIYDVVIVVLGYDGGGLTYDPQNPDLSSLQEMAPCFGYWIKTSAAATLIYADEKLFASAPPDATRNRASVVPRVSVSNTWMNLYGSNVKLDGRPLPAGSTIEAYDDAGVLIGEFTTRKDGQYGFMPIYGPDHYSADMSKVSFSGRISFRINGEAVEQTIDWAGNGERLELSNFSTGKGAAVLPDQFSLSQNFPNPFNPETTIEYQVGKAGHIELAIFNVLGEKIKTLVSEYRPQGAYVAKWSGDTDSGSRVASGVYFYRLTAADFTEVKKMTLLK